MSRLDDRISQMFGDGSLNVQQPQQQPMQMQAPQFPGIQPGGQFAAPPFQASTPKAQPEQLGPLEGFAKSAAWSIGELLGAKPSVEVENWRNENPVGAFTSEVAGFAIPYIGWARAAKAIKPLAKAIDAAGSAEKVARNPFLAPFKQEMITFAPFEAARVGVAMAGGEQISETFGGQGARDTSDLVKEAGFNLAVGGTVLGGFHFLKQSGERAFSKRIGITPGAIAEDPAQIQMRNMKIKLANGEIDEDLANKAMSRLRRQIVNQTAGKDSKYIDNLVGADKQAAKNINRLFGVGRGPVTDRLMFGQAAKDEKMFLDSELDRFQDALNRSGLEDNWDAVQFPRFIETKTREGTKNISKSIRKGLSKVDNEWFMRQDADDGLFVMARQIDKNKWTMFKTDSPERFLPDHELYRKGITSRIERTFSHIQQNFEPIGDGISNPHIVRDTLARLRQSVPLMDYRGLTESLGKAKEITGKIAAATGLDKVADSALAAGGKKFIHDLIAPGMFQFKDSPTAAYLMNAARIAKSTAQASAERLFLGGQVIDKEGSLFAAAYKGAKPDPNAPSINNLIDQLYENASEVEKFQRAVIRELSVDEAIAEYGIGDTAQALLRELDRVDKINIEAKQQLQREFGIAEFVPKENHYMLSRTWEGDWRVPVYEGNRLLSYESGKTLGIAQDRARKIVQEANNNGLNWRTGPEKLSGEIEIDMKLLSGLSKEDMRFFGDVKERALIRENAPGTTTEVRKGVGGFVGDKELWDKDFLKSSVLKQLTDYQVHNSRIATENMFAKEWDALREFEPDTARVLQQRMADLYGTQGPVSRAINDATDKVLAPVMGKNSASKIINATNKALFRLTFGFANTGFNLANTLTFIQTAFPHMAYLANAAPGRIMRDYTYWPAMDQATGKMGSVGQLDILKVGARSFKNMANPDDQLRKLFERAMAEGHVGPRFVEEYVGQNSAKVMDLKSAGSNFSDWIFAVADFLPTQTEKFARGHSFTLGYTFFKDIVGVTDDEMLYQLSRQFTEKTQYLYSMADRPAIMGGPFGATFGLFKNWVTHYMFQMAQYTGEGFARGNWAPLLWQLGGTTAIGGIGALPFYGVADSMSKTLTDESLMANTYDMFAGGPLASSEENIGAADIIYYGLPAFGNLSLQSQVAAPGADPIEDAARFMQFPIMDRMKALGKAVQTGFQFSAATGQNPVQDDETLNLLMRALAPKSLYRGMQAYQANVNNGMMPSLQTGNAQFELSPAEQVMWGLGLNPRWTETQFQIGRELWKDHDKRRSATSAFGRELADAIELGDDAAQRNIITRMMFQNIDASSVIKSARTRLQRGYQDQIDAQFSPEVVLPWAMRGLRPND